MDTTTTDHGKRLCATARPHPVLPSARESTDALMAAAWLGHPAVGPTCRALLVRHGPGEPEWSAASRALILIDLADGEYASAELLSLQLQEHATTDLGVADLVNAVEARSRTSRGLPGVLLHRLRSTCAGPCTSQAAGLLSRARALITPGDAADLQYRRSIHQLEAGHSPREAARTQLLYGEWLRRRKRRADAQAHLTEAHGAFGASGATGFESRAERELLALGTTPRRRVDDERLALTPQEHQIARLAADHLTNKEIAHRLFLSPRTVEYHLHKVFQKLALGSRRELAVAMAAFDPPDALATAG